MKKAVWSAAMAALLVPGLSIAQAPPGLGPREFGLTERELIQAIEQTEELISRCMREQGFQYFAVDQATVRAGMAADKRLPGLSEEEFVNRYGFGVTTLYTGEPAQLAKEYSPAKVGLGERNVAVFQKLSSADQTAYNRALIGENQGMTLAVALETESLSSTGGCTRKALEKTFKPDQLKSTHYNPQDALINNDRRMKSALRFYQIELKKAGYDYAHPDQIEPDLRARLNAITEGGTLRLEQMTPEKRAALKKLQQYELDVARASFKLQEEVLTPVEERIQQELFSRKVP